MVPSPAEQHRRGQASRPHRARGAKPAHLAPHRAVGRDAAFAVERQAVRNAVFGCSPI